MRTGIECRGKRERPQSDGEMQKNKKSMERAQWKQERGWKKRDVIHDPDGERLVVGSSRGLGALS